MIRKSLKVPGYDCIRHPCGKHGCGTRQGSNHGIHNEEWIYLVSDDERECTLSLTVETGLFLPSVPQETIEQITRGDRCPMGSDLTLHASFPTDRDDLKRSDAGRPCEYVKGGRCYGDRSGSLVARDFVRDCFVRSAGFEQPESFWMPLEIRLESWANEARAQRVDLAFERCACCDGLGTVRRAGR